MAILTCLLTFKCRYMKMLRTRGVKGIILSENVSRKCHENLPRVTNCKVHYHLLFFPHYHTISLWQFGMHINLYGEIRPNEKESTLRGSKSRKKSWLIEFTVPSDKWWTGKVDEGYILYSHTYSPNRTSICRARMIPRSFVRVSES